MPLSSKEANHNLNKSNNWCAMFVGQLPAPPPILYSLLVSKNDLSHNNKGGAVDWKLTADNKARFGKRRVRFSPSVSRICQISDRPPATMNPVRASRPPEDNERSVQQLDQITRCLIWRRKLATSAPTSARPHTKQKALWRAKHSLSSPKYPREAEAGDGPVVLDGRK